MNIKIIILTIIIIVAATLRLVALDQYPVGLNADEASLGYNAYSLLQTGKDEYGTSFPLSFKSFGDYKPGLYVYFVMPFVKILGLNEWAVRLPSAFFGIGTIFLVFLLACKIFKNQYVGLFSAGIIALAPWAIHFSRGGWETNVATFFITLGIYCFLLGLEKTRFFFWSGIAFLASMYIYQSPRLVVPILIVVLSALYWKNFRHIYSSQFRKSWHWILVGLVCLALLTIPLVLQFTTGQASARFAGLSIFSDLGAASRVNELRGEHQNPNSLFSELIHNKITAYGPSLLGHYLDHFTGDFLFLNGDPLIRNKVPETGQFFLVESIFLIIGLVTLILAKIPDKKLLFAWILIAPIASSITYQTPHALRALNMVVPLSLVMGFGVKELFGGLGRLRRFGRLVGIIILVVIFTFETVRYLESYYVHYPKRYPIAWEYGFRQMVPKLESYQNDFQKVVITDRYDQPYILVLFYEKYDPTKYQPQAHLTERDKFNFGTIRNFDNLEFRSFKPEEVRDSPATLFIGTLEDVGKDAKIFDKVDFPNNQPAFLFVKGGSE